MEKIVSAADVRRGFGQVLQNILTQGTKYVVERHGEPVAAVVPIEIYEQWKQNRERFFETLRTAQTNANLSDVEATRLASEAVKALRAHQRL